MKTRPASLAEVLELEKSKPITDMLEWRYRGYLKNFSLHIQSKSVSDIEKTEGVVFIGRRMPSGVWSYRAVVETAPEAEGQIIINSWLNADGVRQFFWYEVNGAAEGRTIEMPDGEPVVSLTVTNGKLVVSDR